MQEQQEGKDWGESRKYFRTDIQETKRNWMTRDTKEVIELTAWGQTSQQGKPMQAERLALRWLTLEGDTEVLSINDGLLPPDDHPDVGRTDHMFLQRGIFAEEI